MLTTEEVEFMEKKATLSSPKFWALRDKKNKKVKY